MNTGWITLLDPHPGSPTPSLSQQVTRGWRQLYTTGPYTALRLLHLVERTLEVFSLHWNISCSAVISSPPPKPNINIEGEREKTSDLNPGLPPTPISQNTPDLANDGKMRWANPCQDDTSISHGNAESEALTEVRVIMIGQCILTIPSPLSQKKKGGGVWEPHSKWEENL